MILPIFVHALKSRHLAALILIFAPAALPICAQEFDSTGEIGNAKDIKGVVGGYTSYDSNTFKRPASDNPQSDFISSAYVGLRIDKPFSLQRFKIDVTQTTTRYDKFAHLNSDALDYKGVWQWQMSSSLNGILSASHAEKTVPFEPGDGTTSTARNLSISGNKTFNVNTRIYQDWLLTFGISQIDQKSEQAVRISPDFRSTSNEAGIKYQSPLGNSIAFTLRSTDGEYLNTPPTAIVVDNGYHQDDGELNANWASSAASSFTGRLAVQSRTNNNPAQRDFSGPALNLGYSWKPAGKLSLSLSAGRKIGPLQDPSFSYISTDTVSLAPAWQISTKTSLQAVFSRTINSYRGSGDIPALGPGRKDTLDSAEFRTNWQPLNNLTLNASLQHQQRYGNDPLREFKANLARLTLAMTF